LSGQRRTIEGPTCADVVSKWVPRVPRGDESATLDIQLGGLACRIHTDVAGRSPVPYSDGGGIGSDSAGRSDGMITPSKSPLE
jgi:hypothetical protein